MEDLSEPHGVCQSIVGTEILYDMVRFSNTLRPGTKFASTTPRYNKVDGVVPAVAMSIRPKVYVIRIQDWA